MNRRSPRSHAALVTLFAMNATGRKTLSYTNSSTRTTLRSPTGWPRRAAPCATTCSASSRTTSNAGASNEAFCGCATRPTTANIWSRSVASAGARQFRERVSKKFRELKALNGGYKRHVTPCPNERNIKSHPYIGSASTDPDFVFRL